MEAPEKKKPHSGDFKPGNKGGGRRALPADLVAAKKMAYCEFIETLLRVRELTKAEIKNIDQDTLPISERAMILAYLGKKGGMPDSQAIKHLEDRLFGKAVDQVEINIEGSIDTSLDGIKDTLKGLGIE